MDFWALVYWRIQEEEEGGVWQADLAGWLQLRRLFSQRPTRGTWQAYMGRQWRGRNGSLAWVKGLRKLEMESAKMFRDVAGSTSNRWP